MRDERLVHWVVARETRASGIGDCSKDRLLFHPRRAIFSARCTRLNVRPASLRFYTCLSCTLNINGFYRVVESTAQDSQKYRFVFRPCQITLQKFKHSDVENRQKWNYEKFVQVWILEVNLWHFRIWITSYMMVEWKKIKRKKEASKLTKIEMSRHFRTVA